MVPRAEGPPSKTALLHPWEELLQGCASLWVPVPRLSLVCPALPWLWDPVSGHPGSPWSTCSFPWVLTQALGSDKTANAQALTQRDRSQDIKAAGVSAQETGHDGTRFVFTLAAFETCKIWSDN